MTVKLETRTYLATPPIQQLTFVTRNAAGRLVPTGAGLRCDGVVLQAVTQVDEAASVAYEGRTQVRAAGTIARNASVASNAAGMAVAATTGNVILGRADSAAVAGQILLVELDRNGNLQP
jgi:hypothetical protein